MKNEAKLPEGGQSWRRQPLVWMVIAIPATSVLLGFVMLGLSIYSYDGLVVDDYYKQGMQINRSLARDRAAASLEVEATVTMDKDRGRVHLMLGGNRGFVPSDTVSLNLYHTTRAGSDHRLTLHRIGRAEYEGLVLPELIPGDWHAELTAGEWRLVGRLGDSDETILFQL